MSLHCFAHFADEIAHHPFILPGCGAHVFHLPFERMHLLADQRMVGSDDLRIDNRRWRLHGDRWRHLWRGLLFFR